MPVPAEPNAVARRAAMTHAPPAVTPRAPQPQRVGHHRHRAQAHRERGDHRAEQQPGERVQHAGGDRHAERVVERRRSARFCCMLAHRRLGQSRARAAMPRRSPLTSVTCALDIATSVPVPIAMPTSAAASAGASLMPSPAIATRRPSALSRCTSATLSCGRTSPCTSSMPSARADGPCGGCRRRRWPSRCACRRRAARAIASACAGLDRVGHRDQRPRARRRPPGTSRWRPRRAGRSARSASASIVDAQRPASAPVLPSASARPSTRPRTPMPVTDSKSCAGAERQRRACAPRRRSPPRADARCPGRGSPRAAAPRPRRHRPPAIACGTPAGPRSACRSCRRSACRCGAAARSPRRRGTARRPARRGRSRP